MPALGDAEIGNHGLGGGIVVLERRQFEQLARVDYPSAYVAQRGNDTGEGDALFAESLGARRMVPDVWRFKFALDFDQALGLVFIVKDTPLARRAGAGGL